MFLYFQTNKFNKCPTSVQHMYNKSTSSDVTLYNKRLTIVQQVFTKCTASVRQVSEKCPTSVRQMSIKCSTSVQQVFNKCSNSVQKVVNTSRTRLHKISTQIIQQVANNGPTIPEPNNSAPIAGLASSLFLFCQTASLTQSACLVMVPAVRRCGQLPDAGNRLQPVGCPSGPAHWMIGASTEGMLGNNPLISIQS